MLVVVVGILLVPIYLFWFRWTSRASVHWTVPIIGSNLFGVTALLLFVSCTSQLDCSQHQRLMIRFSQPQNAVPNYFADAYPTYAASILAGNDSIRSMFGAVFPLFAKAMYVNLVVGGPVLCLCFSPACLSRPP